MFAGATYAAWIELVVAARTDAKLQSLLVDVNQRFDDAVIESFRRTFAVDEATAAFDPAIAVRFAFAALVGRCDQPLPQPPNR